MLKRDQFLFEIHPAYYELWVSFPAEYDLDLLTHTLQTGLKESGRWDACRTIIFNLIEGRQISSLEKRKKIANMLASVAEERRLKVFFLVSDCTVACAFEDESLIESNCIRIDVEVFPSNRLQPFHNALQLLRDHYDDLSFREDYDDYCKWRQLRTVLAKKNSSRFEIVTTG